MLIIPRLLHIGQDLRTDGRHGQCATHVTFVTKSKNRWYYDKSRTKFSSSITRLTQVSAINLSPLSDHLYLCDMILN